MSLRITGVRSCGQRHSVSERALARGAGKTAQVIWDILRCWIQEHPVKERDASAATPGSVILAKEPKLTANFSRAKGAFSKAKEEGVVRFPNNPEANWGPKMRAGRPGGSAAEGVQPAPPAKRRRRDGGGD